MRKKDTAHAGTDEGFPDGFRDQYSKLEKNVLTIDETNLRGEWLRQPMIYSMVSFQAGEVGFAATAIGLQIEEKEAAIAVDCRTKGVPGFAKVTDAAVEAVLANTVELQQLRRQQALLTAQKNLLERLARAIEMKGYSLKYVQLGGDFDTPEATNTSRTPRARDAEAELREMIGNL